MALEDALKAEILKALISTKGNLAPLGVRLAWHASGTYSKYDGTGGLDGATMRFDPESADDANAGIGIVRDALLAVQQKFPSVSVADIWGLCGIVAIEAMGGPKIPFNIGREDAPNGQFCPAVGRLPDASQGAQHLRDVFYRMGFDDRSIVALSGAHTLGHCHESRSGYDGPWTHKPYKFDNSYFRLLLNLDWVPRKWDGPLQFEDATTGKLMMLPSDLCLLSDPSFKKYVELYATDQKAFFDDFSDAFSTLLAKGGRAKVQPGYVEDEEGEGSASDLDESLLRYYAATGSLSRLQLIAHRVDADAVDTTTGRSALHNAVFFGHGNVVKYLLRELHVNANVADHQGDTPLHDAARFGLNEIVSDLLAAGAIPNARNRQGKTAAEVALCSGKHMTVSLIPTASRL